MFLSVVGRRERHKRERAWPHTSTLTHTLTHSHTRSGPTHIASHSPLLLAPFYTDTRVDRGYDPASEQDRSSTPSCTSPPRPTSIESSPACTKQPAQPPHQLPSYVHPNIPITHIGQCTSQQRPCQPASLWLLILGHWRRPDNVYSW